MLTYGKWGTRVMVCDEDDARLLEFVEDGAKATAEGRGWEILPGPPERRPAGSYMGEGTVAYLWPVVREGQEAHG